jgi:hypothetical protein
MGCEREKREKQAAEGEKDRHTSDDVVISAFQSIRGKILTSSFGFSSMVSWTSSASLGCSGKDWLDVLQAFTAQVRKLMVRIFILWLCFVKRPGGYDRGA